MAARPTANVRTGATAVRIEEASLMSEPLVSLITGAGSGIGAGLAEAAIERGHRVYLVDIAKERLEAICQRLGPNAIPRIVDVGDAAAMEELAAEVFSAEGRVDYLFNNAGILRGGFSWEISAADWQTAINVNLLGVVNGVRSFVPRMIAAGRIGHIVNNASASGVVSAPMIAPYAATKFAVTAFTEALTVELQLKEAGLQVHLMLPGSVRSSIYDEVLQGATVNDAVAQMGKYTLATGMEPGAFARLTFEGIDRGEFWLISHPEMVDPLLQRRTERVIGRVAPTPAHHSFDG